MSVKFGWKNLNLGLEYIVLYPGTDVLGNAGTVIKHR